MYDERADTEPMPAVIAFDETSPAISALPRGLTDTELHVVAPRAATASDWPPAPPRPASTARASRVAMFYAVPVLAPDDD